MAAMPRTAGAALVALLALSSCSSTPKPAPAPSATDDELAPKDVDPNAPPPELGKVKPAAPAKPAADAAPRRPGIVATLLYVTEVEDKSRPSGMRPAAMVFSSDPDSPYINDRPRASRILKQLEPDEMKDALAELDGQGLSTLPWKDQPTEDPIPPDRAIYIFRDGGRRVVKKAELANDDQRIVFTRIEKKLIYTARRTK
jgi:hypothetical protein